MAEASHGQQHGVVELEDMEIPLESDVVPLEECEESGKAITTTTLVGKVLCEKTLNRVVVKNIIVKAWGNPDLLSIVDLDVNCFMFNFS